MLKKKAVIINLSFVLLGFLSLDIWLIRRLVGCGYRWPSLALWMFTHQALASWLWALLPLIIFGTVIAIIILVLPKPNFWAGLALFLATAFLFGVLVINSETSGFRGCFNKSRIETDATMILLVLERNYFSEFGSYTSSVEELARGTGADFQKLNRWPWLYEIDILEPNKDLKQLEVKAVFNNTVIFRCAPYDSGRSTRMSCKSSL